MVCLAHSGLLRFYVPNERSSKSVLFVASLIRQLWSQSLVGFCVQEQKYVCAIADCREGETFPAIRNPQRNNPQKRNVVCRRSEIKRRKITCPPFYARLRCLLNLSQPFGLSKNEMRMCVECARRFGSKWCTTRASPKCRPRRPTPR